MALDERPDGEQDGQQAGGDDPLDKLLKKYKVGGGTARAAAPAASVRDPLDDLLAKYGVGAESDTLDRASANDSAYTTGDVDFRTPADRHAEAERQRPAIGTPENPIHMAPTIVSAPDGSRPVTRLAQLGQAIAPRDATMLAKPSSAAPPRAPAVVSPALAAAIEQAKPALDIPVGGAKIAGSIITSPLTAGRYLGQKNLEAMDPSFRDVPEQIPGVANVSDREGAEAGLQTAALAAGPLINRLVTGALAKGAIRAGLAGDVAETGVVGGAGRLAPTLGAGAEGATIGAAYDPEHPGRGAALGGLLGAASDVAGRLNGANGRQPQMEPDRTLPRPQRPAPTATARIVDEAQGAAPVETAPVAAQPPAPPPPVTPEPVAPGVTPPEHVVVRSGVIGPDGAYFRRTGGAPVEGEVAYDTRNAKIADGTDPAVVQAIMDQASTYTSELRDRQRALLVATAENGVIDAATRDTLPVITKAAQALGYDGIQVAPTDPKAPPSVFVWNIRKLTTAGQPVEPVQYGGVNAEGWPNPTAEAHREVGDQAFDVAHEEVVNELTAAALDYQRVVTALAKGLDPSTGKPLPEGAKGEARRKRLAEDLVTGPEGYANTLAAYEDWFGPEGVKVLLEKGGLPAELTPETVAEDEQASTVIAGERVGAPAIRTRSGQVVAGANHGDAFAAAAKAGLPHEETKDAEQGFVTSHRPFVGRKDAAEIAYRAGQIATAESHELGHDELREHEEQAPAPAPTDEGVAAPPSSAPAGTSATPEKKQYDYSSTQIDLPPEHAAGIKALAAKIPDADLAPDGREDAPHITVKYGLHGNEPEKVRTLLADEPPVTVTLGKTSHFPDSGSGDVVKVDVDSPALHALNKKIADALPHTDTHPEYKPHATVAYVKKGLGKQYAGDASLAGHTITLDHVTFSGKDGTKVEIPLGGKSAPQPAAGGLPIALSENDLPYKAAYDAYYNNSMSPDRRAKSEQAEYVRHITAVHDELAPLAVTPEQQATLAAELERYRQGYLTHTLKLLGATSRTASPMVTGPANFPVARNRKALDREHKLRTEFIEWSKRAQSAMRKAIAPESSGRVSADDPHAVETLGKKIAEARALQERMKAVNKTLGSFRSVRGKTDEQLRAAVQAAMPKLRAAGLSDADIAEALKPDPMGGIGYPSYRLQNNLANIKRMEERVAGMARASTQETSERPFTGGRLVDNVADNRVQLFFDAKPTPPERDALRRAAFKWAPSVGAWQRQRTANAMAAAKQLLGDRLKPAAKPAPESEFDTPEIRALEAKAAAIPSTHTIDTPERNEWRHQQIDRMARFTKAGKVAQIVMGHAGSGKTSLLTEPLAQATGAALLDSDVPKAAAPEYAGGLGATALNTESAQIRTEAMRRVVEQGGNLVFPTRGDPQGTVALAKALLAHGYTVHVRLMDVPPEVSARRMLDGYRAGTRHFVSPRSILEWGDAPRRAFHALSQLDGVTIHDPLDNDVPRGTEPRALPDWRERWGFPDSESPGGDAAVRPGPGPDRGPVHGGLPGEGPAGEAEGVAGRRGGAEQVQEDGVSRFSSARTPSGVRRPVARVSTTGLLHELLDMEQKRADAEARAVYELREDPNFHTSGIPQIVSTKTPGGGPSRQAKAGKNLTDFERITDEIFSELQRRMPKEDIWQAVEDARAERDERAGLTDESATDASKRDQVHTGTISFARAAPRGTDGPDLFGNTPAPSADDQGALFGENAGTEAARSLRQTEVAAREEIDRLRPLASAPGDAGAKAKARIAELEKLVNRDKAISADELRTRAGAEQGGLAFARAGGSGTPHAKPAANVPVGSAAPPAHPLPEATGLTQRRPSVRIRDLTFAIRALFNPESLGPIAKGTAGTIRHENALKFRRLTIAREALRDFGREIGKLTPAEAVRYWDAAEQGQSVGNAAHDAGNALLHKITQERTDELIALGRLKAEAAIAHYLGRFWSTPTDTKGRNVLASIMGKRPLEGGKSFLKHRSLERFTDGLDAGLIPATYNYVDAQLAKIAEMERLIAAERTLRTELERGRARKVLDVQGQEAPVDDEGTPWVRIGDGTDPAFTVFGPPAVTAHEAYDAQVRQGLESAIQRLGVTHDRKSATGQRGALGFAKADQAIVSKFGSHDGVLMHELGHILDARYGLGARLATADGADKELHDLAVLRHETNANVKPSFREYVQKPEERTANALHALLHAPDRMQQVAPHVKAALESFLHAKPELAPILDIRPSLELATGTTDIRIPGVSTIGHWYAPKPAAAVWNNHLSRGLRGNPLYDAYMAPVQAASQLMLGLSGFHGTVIASEGVFSDLALAIDDLANEGGKAIQAPGRIVKSSVAPVTLARLGSKVMREFRAPGTHPELAKVLDAMLAGGYRGTAESEFWTGERLDNLRSAFTDAVRAESKGRRLWGAARLPLDALWAGLEVAAKPILGKYVPLMKTGATYAAVSRALAKLPPDAPMDQIHATMADVVKEMDYRFGQVTYDNHFTNTVVKHIAQAMFLAPGWTFGTATLMGRGARDVARTMGRVGGGAYGGESPIDGTTGEDAPPRELVGKSAAYWLGAFAATMLVNGLLTYVNTKEQPHGKDFFAFRDGTKDHDGNWNRHRIPGYIMHDVYGWTHHPVTTFKNKLSPVLAFMERLADNTTYYGDLIYDPDAPTATKLKDVAKAVGQQVAPISVQNFLESKKRGETGPGEVARSAAGVGPAPREFVRTAAQNKLAEYLARRGHTALTPDQADEMQIRRDVLNGLRDRTVSRDSIRLLIGKGELTRTQALHAMQAVRVDPLVAKFKQLSPEEAQVVYALGTEDEQHLWKRAMRVKAANYRRDHGHPLPPAAAP